LPPLAQTGQISSDRETPPATFQELAAFRANSLELGFALLATAALNGCEWLQRGEDIFCDHGLAHNRSKERPRGDGGLTETGDADLIDTQIRVHPRLRAGSFLRRLRHALSPSRRDVVIDAGWGSRQI
jgi:hypothetical protein